MPAAASISDASSPKIHEKKEPLIDRWIQIRSLSLTRPPTLHSYRPAFDAASRPSVSDMPPKGLLALAYCQLISTFLAVRNPSSLAGAALNTGVELRLDKMRIVGPESSYVAYQAWETDEEFVCHLTQTAEFCWCDIDARSIGLHPAQRLEERQGAKERWWVDCTYF
ncbi:hypothetical protein LTR56_023927 [Elasticomyces elasticus]|nr:hypothetical protein LTR56_023927 [Elasticomyces elasticus]